MIIDLGLGIVGITPIRPIGYGSTTGQEFSSSKGFQACIAYLSGITIGDGLQPLEVGR